jgi:TPR repeat protein
MILVLGLGIGFAAETAAQAPPGGPYADAMGWYQREAEGGNPRAQFLYGYRFEIGEGVALDAALARSWYAKAASQGERRAQYRLARLYQIGEGGAVDEPAALAWFRAAAQAGHVAAQSMIGYFYASGVAVEADPANAYLWFSLAARAGDALAAENLRRLTATLTEDQKAAGEALVKAWEPAP